MKAVTLERFAKPREALGVIEREVPKPGPSQALVRMVLSPIHNHDLMIVRGLYGSLPELPSTPGTEAVGVVEAVGADVTALKPGQRVAGGAPNAWAQYYIAEAGALVPVPDAVNDETACQLMSMPLSAKMLLAELDVKEGDWIVQNAANGLVGKLVSRFGKARGINVLSLVRRDDAVAELAKLCIANVVSTEKPGWKDRVREITGSAPIIRGVDSVGGKGASDVLDLLAEGGQFVNFGALTSDPIPVTATQLLFRRLTLRGFWAAKPNLSRETIGALRKELLEEAAAGQIDLPVHETFPLERIADACEASDVPGRTGKIVLSGA